MRTLMHPEKPCCFHSDCDRTNQITCDMYYCIMTLVYDLNTAEEKELTDC